MKSYKVDSGKNFAFPLSSMFGFVSVSLKFPFQVRSSQASAKLAEESAASRDEMHKQEVFSFAIFTPVSKSSSWWVLASNWRSFEPCKLVDQPRDQ